MNDTTQKTQVRPDKGKSLKNYKIPGYLSLGVIALASVNIIFTFLMFVLLGRLEDVAKEHNLYRNRSLDRTSESDLSVYQYELEASREVTENIARSFPDETGLLEFIDNVERLRGRSVSKITFASKEPLKDKEGNLGIPIVIEFQGSWGEILSDIREIQNIPYIFKPVKLDSEKQDFVSGELQQMSQTQADEASVSFGGFLYVNEEFSKNR